MNEYGLPPERNPAKKPRDLARANALLAVIDAEALKVFPREVAAHALGSQPKG